MKSKLKEFGRWIALLPAAILINLFFYHFWIGELDNQVEKFSIFQTTEAIWWSICYGGFLGIALVFIAPRAKRITAFLVFTLLLILGSVPHVKLGILIYQGKVGFEQIPYNAWIMLIGFFLWLATAIVAIIWSDN